MRALLIVACLLLIVMALMRLPSALRSRLPSGPPRRDELVKDPVCQTYVLMSRAIREEAGGAPWRTHEVFNQAPPLEGRDVFSDNTPLVEATEREGAAWALERARERARDRRPRRPC